MVLKCYTLFHHEFPACVLELAGGRTEVGGDKRNLRAMLVYHNGVYG